MPEVEGHRGEKEQRSKINHLFPTDDWLSGERQGEVFLERRKEHDRSAAEVIND